MKLKYFFKFDHKKEPIPGSNVKRKSKPGNQWTEIIPVCCESDSIECTCGWRYFVQIDRTNKPVDGTLIRRKSWPKMSENIKYQEVQAPDCCALIGWQFVAANDGSIGNVTITVDGVTFVDQDLVAGDDFFGSFRPKKSGSVIRIIVTNTGAGTPSSILNITNGHVYTDIDVNIDYIFNFNNKNTSIVVNLSNA